MPSYELHTKSTINEKNDYNKSDGGDIISNKTKDTEIRQSNGLMTTKKMQSDDNQAIRQSAIIDKIRQSEGMQIQIKDIIAAFPNYSERTLRYDVQRLCSQGVIERIGSGGPGTRYKIRVL